MSGGDVLALPWRANGEGTLFRRKDGRWVAAVYLPTTTGASAKVRLRAHQGGGPSEADGVAASGRSRVPLANRVWRVGDYLSYWLDEIARPRVRDSTYAKYETFVRCYLVPSLGRRRLGRLSTPDVRQFLKQMAASDKSSATVSGCLRRPASGVGGSGSRGPRVPERGGDGGPTQGGEA